MKKLIVFIVFILLTINSFSQEKLLIVGINYNIVFYNYNFTNPVYDDFGRETTYEYKSKYNYSTGISFEYIKKLFVGLDLNYSTKGYILEYNFKAFDLNDPVFPVKSTVEAGYIDINLGLGYSYYLNKQIGVIPNIKLIYSGLVNDKITTLSGDNKEYTSKEGKGILITQELKKNIFSTGLGVNFKINLIKSLSIGIEPSLLYSFNKISEKAIKTNSVFYFLKFSVYYKLNKNEE